MRSMYCTRLFWQHLLSYKASGLTRVASRVRVGFLRLYYTILYFLRCGRGGIDDGGGKIQYTNILGQIPIELVHQEWIASGKPPPAIRAWGRAGMMATAALSYSPLQEGKRRWPARLWRGNRALRVLPFLYNILPSLGLSRKNTLLGDPKSFALLVGCPSFLHLDTATKTYISIDSFSLLHSKADREGTLHIKYVRTRPPYLPIQGTQDSLALYAAIYHSAFVPLQICPQRSRLMTAPGEITSLVCKYCVGWKYSVFWGLSRDNRSVLDALPACRTQHPRSQLPTMSASRDVQYRAA